MNQLIGDLQNDVTDMRLNITAKNAVTREGRDEIEHHIATITTLLADIQEKENND